MVTAPTGAAVRDIMNITRRRNPFVQLILYPALVQGENAADSIVQGIRTLDEYGVDVMIVGRGGGSIEDLWAFNEEKVARAIFECRTPVISAVGHETDTTIADLVADRRAPTPSAAAELAVVEYRQLMSGLELYRNQLADRVEQKILQCRQKAEFLRLRLQQASPEYQLREKKQHAADLEDRLRRTMEQKLIERKHTAALYAERLDGMSPLKKLQQGYSYIEDETGRALTGISQTAPGKMLKIHLADGVVAAKTTAVYASGSDRKESDGREDGR